MHFYYNLIIYLLMQNFSLFWGRYFGRGLLFYCKPSPNILCLQPCFSPLFYFFCPNSFTCLLFQLWYGKNWQKTTVFLLHSFVYKSKSKKNNGTEILSEVVCVVLTTCTRPFRLVDILAKYDLISFQRFFSDLQYSWI